VVLTTGCDKTTPALLMAAATVDLPAIVRSGGPMLDGNYKGRRVGSGTVLWEARMQYAAGEIGYEEFIETVAASAPSMGHCNTMGTATTMNSLAEALGMSLPGCAAIPAPYRERGQMAYETGRRAVEIVWEDLTPSKILTREAFLNAVAVNTAIGGSTNAPIHLAAIARHAGVELSLDDWQAHGYELPLLVNLQPAGEYLGEGALENGVDVCVSSWQRAQPNTYPSAAKAAGHYTNSQLIRMEALTNGYDEGIALAPSGIVSEGSGMNLFLVRDGVVITPFLDGTSLEGITRSAILTIARDLGLEAREQQVPRESLYTADEIFFTGTAAEVTPVRSVDRIPIRTALSIQKRFLETVRGRNDDPHGWLTYVEG